MMMEIPLMDLGLLNVPNAYSSTEAGSSLTSPALPSEVLFSSAGSSSSSACLHIASEELPFDLSCQNIHLGRLSPTKAPTSQHRIAHALSSPCAASSLSFASACAWRQRLGDKGFDGDQGKGLLFLHGHDNRRPFSSSLQSSSSTSFVGHQQYQNLLDGLAQSFLGISCHGKPQKQKEHRTAAPLDTTAYYQQECGSHQQEEQRNDACSSKSTVSGPPSSSTFREAYGDLSPLLAEDKRAHQQGDSSFVDSGPSLSPSSSEESLFRPASCRRWRSGLTLDREIVHSDSALDDATALLSSILSPDGRQDSLASPSSVLMEEILLNLYSEEEQAPLIAFSSSSSEVSLSSLSPSSSFGPATSPPSQWCQELECSGDLHQTPEEEENPQEDQTCSPSQEQEERRPPGNGVQSSLSPSSSGLAADKISRKRKSPGSTFSGRLPRRDPKKPRGSISGFNFFAMDVRGKIITQNPHLQQGKSQENNNAVNILIGKAWKQLAVEKRKSYEARALQDKLRYLKEMNEYVPSPGFQRAVPRLRPSRLKKVKLSAAADAISAASDETCCSKVDVMKRIEQLTAATRLQNEQMKLFEQQSKIVGDAPRRPWSPYICFVRSQSGRALQQEQEALHGGRKTSWPQAGKLLGQIWRGMDGVAREEYVRMADEDERRYEREVKEWRERSARLIAQEEASKEVDTGLARMSGACETGPGEDDVLLPLASPVAVALLSTWDDCDSQYDSMADSGSLERSWTASPSPSVESLALEADCAQGALV